MKGTTNRRALDADVQGGLVPDGAGSHRTGRTAERAKVQARVLDDIERQHGCLTAELVVEHAKHSRSAIHADFDWSDTVAAKKWRLHQAQELIRAYQTWKALQATTSAPRQQAPEMVRVREFLSITRDGKYHRRRDVVSDATMREMFEARQVATLKTFIRETSDLPRLARVREKVIEAVALYEAKA